MINKAALHKISYGLFVLSAKWGEKDAGCIINTAAQITDTPLRISVAVNKQNFTHDAILNTKKFNVSVLTEKTPFSVFENFGFRSSRDVDKFVAENPVSNSGIRYINDYANSFLSADVVEVLDFDTHTVFVGEVTEAVVLSEEPSVTYAYYHKNIKPAPAKKEDGGKVWVCKICGYVYDEKTEGVPFEELPEDWVCPLCKHPKSDFELQ